MGIAGTKARRRVGSQAPFCLFFFVCVFAIVCNAVVGEEVYVMKRDLGSMGSLSAGG